MIKNVVVFGLLLAFFMYGCKTVPMTGRKQFVLIPSAEMQALSYQQYAQVIKESKLSTNQAQIAMVQRVGGRIQKAVDTYMADKGLSARMKGFAWEFNLIEENTVNAWCMPGGKVAVYTGLLSVTQNETALAIVLGHEVAHAIAEHGAERMTQTLAAQGFALGLQVALREKPQMTQAIFMQAFGGASNLGILKFSRAHETEADKMGLIFAAMAGYDPQEAVPFWERMAAASGGQAPPEFLSTHPSHDTRIADLQALMPEALQVYEANRGLYGN